MLHPIRRGGVISPHKAKVVRYTISKHKLRNDHEKPTRAPVFTLYAFDVSAWQQASAASFVAENGSNANTRTRFGRLLQLA
jgi:hypothetical protein